MNTEGPFSGGTPDFSKMMKSAQEVLQKMEKVRRELDKTEVTGEAGAGLVKIVLFANLTVKQVSIDESLLKEEKTVLEEMMASAIADAIRRAEAKQKEKASHMMSDFPGGVSPSGPFSGNANPFDQFKA